MRVLSILMGSGMVLFIAYADGACKRPLTVIAFAP